MIWFFVLFLWIRRLPHSGQFFILLMSFAMQENVSLDV